MQHITIGIAFAFLRDSICQLTIDPLKHLTFKVSPHFYSFEGLTHLVASK